uniref:arabinogalactan protein 1-like n=1 Tax=Arvicanthis niloticus TaxID=61156 RepID=UPI00148636D3|nr:arabinogalactan protein 1-like [Arvicanthis niloticus]
MQESMQEPMQAPFLQGAAGFSVPRTPRLCVAALRHADTGSGNAPAFLPTSAASLPRPAAAPQPAPCLRAEEVLAAFATAGPCASRHPRASPPACSPRAPADPARPRRPRPLLRAPAARLARSGSPESRRADLGAWERRRPCTPPRGAAAREGLASVARVGGRRGERLA